ncbi:hypothetical protein EVJ50_03935 [Synechococcus sp. RSCCF101]|uniref:hypothetical protein n=1 Tax=Synechococcus sp. RSCCF101 TaxID=2511069 RepID=UPI001247CADB|nr:hypothetical protein [Synechococcus sp. RSCCF101]QEY31527.1 hypothetical protein EVJ50_03935 [Synechococcus sp. RSCCF101]
MNRSLVALAAALLVAPTAAADGYGYGHRRPAIRDRHVLPNTTYSRQRVGAVTVESWRPARGGGKGRTCTSQTVGGQFFRNCF